MSSTATPQICATWAAVMPYFSHERMRETCDAGTDGVDDGSGETGI